MLCSGEAEEEEEAEFKWFLFLNNIFLTCTHTHPSELALLGDRHKPLVIFDNEVKEEEEAAVSTELTQGGELFVEGQAGLDPASEQLHGGLHVAGTQGTAHTRTLQQDTHTHTHVLHSYTLFLKLHYGRTKRFEMMSF